MNKSFRRRNIFIDKNFQTKFVIKFCFVSILSSLILILLLLSLLNNSTTVAIENTQVIVKKTSDFIMPFAIVTTFTVIIASSICVLFLALFISHKISGPLFRFKKEIDILKTGDLNRSFAIRGNDQLQELSKSLVEACDFLKNRFTALNEITTDLENNINETSDKVAKDIKKLRKELDNIKI